MTRDGVAASALELAEREGLAAVSIRRLADLQGVTPMALYWHFRDKEAILDAVAEQLFLRVAIRDRGSQEPWEAIRQLLLDLLEVFRRYPVSAGLATGRIFASPAALRVSDHGVALLMEAGLDGTRAAQAVRFLLRAVTTLATSTSRVPGAAGRGVEDSRRALADLDDVEFPHLVRVRDQLTPDVPEDDYYVLAVDILVAGLRSVSPSRG